eukprot:PhM_4_TR15523/c0_g1_i1/m.63745
MSSSAEQQCGLDYFLSESCASQSSEVPDFFSRSLSGGGNVMRPFCPLSAVNNSDGNDEGDDCTNRIVLFKANADRLEIVHRLEDEVAHLERALSELVKQEQEIDRAFRAKGVS